MKEQKIDFIIAYNDERYFQECVFYIGQLLIPDGYEVGLLGITDGQSMASAYNEGMKASEAKYKVYLHQDVFILNKNFIADILSVFQSDPTIGMLGLLGGFNLPAHAYYCQAWNVGRTGVGNVLRMWEMVKAQSEAGISVEAIDGMMMITQYDLPWREDLFTGWDFYDASQSFEFRRQGYRVVVPWQEASWCLHDIGVGSLIHYDRWRRVFCREYLCPNGEEILAMPDTITPEKEKWATEIGNRLIRLADQGVWKGIADLLKGLDTREMYTTEIRILKNISDIHDLEINDAERDYSLFTEHGRGWRDIYGWYKEVVFLARRIEQGYTGEEQVGELVAAVREGEISLWALSVIGKRAMFDWEKLVAFLQAAPAGGSG